MKHPYADLPDYCFWSRSMTWVQPGRIDPVTRSEVIGKDEKVATMGSCFAQYLARQIEKSGLNYFVTEDAPAGMSQEAAKSANFRVFSARYGNVYTVEQANQLFDRAFGHFVPADDIWSHGPDFVDAFRPTIVPERFSSAEDVRAERAAHLGHVRRMFEEADWMVLTLGLTEGWRSRADGAMYPVAPGVSGGHYDPDKYEFVNFGVQQVTDALHTFIERLRGVNPTIRFLLTVSPVALAATYEDRHVLSSTTVSKAILRVACDEVERNVKGVYYFPSYEIITSPATSGAYYDDNLREVKPIGVAHVMRVFSENFIAGSNAAEQPAYEGGAVQNEHVVCEEGLIEEAMRISRAG
jgi:hypothetical protein